MFVNFQATSPSSTAYSPEWPEVAGLDGSPSVDGVSGALEGADGIVASAGQQLMELDDQMLTLQRSIQGNVAEANDLGRKLEALHAIQNWLNAEGKKGSKNVPIDDISIPGPDGTSLPAGQVLADLGLEEYVRLRTTVATDGPPERAINLDSVESAIEQLESAQSRANSGNELSLLQMQQVMHQRSQVIEMASQLLRSMHRAADTVVENLGR